MRGFSVVGGTLFSISTSLAAIIRGTLKSVRPLSSLSQVLTKAPHPAHGALRDAASGPLSSGRSVDTIQVGCDNNNLPHVRLCVSRARHLRGFLVGSWYPRVRPYRPWRTRCAQPHARRPPNVEPNTPTTHSCSQGVSYVRLHVPVIGHGRLP